MFLRLFEGCFEVVWNVALEVVLIVVLSVVWRLFRCFGACCEVI